MEDSRHAVVNEFLSSKAKRESDADLRKLDKLVGEYLSYRGYHESMASLEKEILSVANQNNLKLKKFKGYSQFDDGRHILEDGQSPLIRIVNAFENGDYSLLLNLWDTFILSEIKVADNGSKMSSNVALLQEMLHVEFLIHIYTSSFPFRLDTVRKAGSPKVAAVVAARSMTIFKHYIDSRGPIIQQFDSKGDYANYKNLHKIAFPPTHPIFKHIFTREWGNMVKCALIDFLSKFFFEKKAPMLVKIYKSAKSDKKDFIAQSRESALLNVTRNICSASEDLLVTLEQGVTVDKKTLRAFREKFDILKNMISSNVDANSTSAESKMQQHVEQNHDVSENSGAGNQRIYDDA